MEWMSFIMTWMNGKMKEHDMTWNDMNEWMKWRNEWMNEWMNQWMKWNEMKSLNEWMNDWMIEWHECMNVGNGMAWHGMKWTSMQRNDRKWMNEKMSWMNEWNEIKWNESKWNEIKWNDMKWNFSDGQSLRRSIFPKFPISHLERFV